MKIKYSEKFSSSIILATFQVPGSHVWPVAAMLDMDMEHFLHCRKFWWTEPRLPLSTSRLLPRFLSVGPETEKISHYLRIPNSTATFRTYMILSQSGTGHS